ncbi:MAG: hypothetical protein LBG18_07550 [Mediterranea sp.]|jgi:hypothetical protein|nr:hypothetical protein [Mediterranea sp.]
MIPKEKEHKLIKIYMYICDLYDSDYFMNIKNRADKRRTKFTDLMCGALSERMTEADRKPRKNNKLPVMHRNAGKKPPVTLL